MRGSSILVLLNQTDIWSLGKKTMMEKFSSFWTTVPLFYEEMMIGIFTGHPMVFF